MRQATTAEVRLIGKPPSSGPATPKCALPFGCQRVGCDRILLPLSPPGRKITSKRAGNPENVGLYSRARDLVGDRNPREHEFVVQLRSFNSGKSGANLGVAVLIALCSALLGRSLINREEIIAKLRAHQAELCRRGVRHAALFGSLARGEGKRTSDIDILIELDPQAPVGLFEYVGITQYLSDLFPVQVDVTNRSSLKPLVRPSVERDALYAF